ncbi:MAG: HDOD domain-containing protein [Marinobacter sp.]|nr:HDOD domain-containing protein [Marinobacter sp.]
MPNLFSWLTGLFHSAEQKGTPVRNSRLLNPAVSTEAEEPDTNLALHRLEENLFCWLLSATPSQLEQPSENARQVLTELSERVKAGKLDELPRQPLTLPTLMRALSDETTGRHELTQIILRDPALTDQILSVANSPYFRPTEQSIDSVDQAIFLLGMDGIRSVISATILRPMLAARNSSEALFAQRVWRWGMVCARAAEQISRLQGGDTSAFFMVALLPAMAYMTLRREVQRIYRARIPGVETEPQVVRQALEQFDWATTQLLAKDWNLPPRYHAHLFSAERPAPRAESTPLNDGIILGTREVLRQSHQRNLAEEDLRKLLRLDERQFATVRGHLLAMLRDGTT